MALMCHFFRLEDWRSKQSAPPAFHFDTHEQLVSRSCELVQLDVLLLHDVLSPIELGLDFLRELFRRVARRG